MPGGKKAQECKLHCALRCTVHCAALRCTALHGAALTSLVVTMSSPLALSALTVSSSSRKSVLQPTIMYGTLGQYCVISGTHCGSGGGWRAAW